MICKRKHSKVVSQPSFLSSSGYLPSLTADYNTTSSSEEDSEYHYLYVASVMLQECSASNVLFLSSNNLMPGGLILPISWRNYSSNPDLTQLNVQDLHANRAHFCGQRHKRFVGCGFSLLKLLATQDKKKK